MDYWTAILKWKGSWFAILCIQTYRLTIAWRACISWFESHGTKSVYACMQDLWAYSLHSHLRSIIDLWYWLVSGQHVSLLNNYVYTDQNNVFSIFTVLLRGHLSAAACLHATACIGLYNTYTVHFTGSEYALYRPTLVQLDFSKPIATEYYINGTILQTYKVYHYSAR